ncbi:TIGR01777 family oxidoreductase [Acrocarpospora catenulata]|uniref:TIGR01777 family oxidoreductase n=1 Tax=Acrocarpospora catenulata TaxID=2836182 RepID=UPI001BDAD854|nr:TIGR01777 family oxidoreductase [Acrocarpospora catenulata]
MTIVVTGSSGLLGSALVRSLTADDLPVLRLVRREPTGPGEASWDPDRGVLDPAVLEGASAVVHLAGAGIGDRRWSESYKRQILESRTHGTGTLAATIAKMTTPPPVLLSASAVGFYGDTGDRAVDEKDAQGKGFLADVVAQWEGATGPAAAAGVRVVRMRSGVVLSRSGGALAKVLPIFRLGMGAPLGSGRQYFSWISLPDWVAAVRFLLTRDDISGPVNLTSPQPVTNAEYTKAIGRALKRATMPIPTPGFALRLALGEFADEGVLIGQRVLPRVLLDAGFPFTQPALDDALAATLAA